MGRISDIFAAARRERRGLVLPFLTAGDPDLATTMRLLAAVYRVGAPIVELGIPFSDPIADGPVIAESMHQALLRGVTPNRIFDAVRGMRTGKDPAMEGAANGLGIMAMVSVSIVQRMGTERFVDAVGDAQLDGVIVPDIDIDLAPKLAEACDRRDLACSLLIAPTSKPERIRVIVESCRGFVYLLARAGVTGTSQDASAPALPELRRQVDAIRQISATIPIAAGFGIATPEHVRATLQQVDGAIVGSAIVRCIGAAVAQKSDPVLAVEQLVGALVAASR